MHTQGRIRYHENGDANSYALLDADGQWLMTILHNGHQVTEQQRENLRRIAACWNACQTIETEVLEQHALGVITAEHSQRLHDMEAALKKAAKINPFGSVENAEARDAAISIVIKREGEAP